MKINKKILAQLSKLKKPKLPWFAQRRIIWSEEDEAMAEDLDMYDEPYMHPDTDWDQPMW